MPEADGSRAAMVERHAALTAAAVAPTADTVAAESAVVHAATVVAVVVASTAVAVVEVAPTVVVVVAVAVVDTDNSIRIKEKGPSASAGGPFLFCFRPQGERRGTPPIVWNLFRNSDVKSDMRQENIPQGLKRLRKKAWIRMKGAEKHTSGPEGPFIPCDLYRG
jgi:hypothetical protein